MEHDVRNEYADGIERLQTRLLHIGLFLLTVVMIGGGAGVLMVVTRDSNAVGVSIAVVAGCAVAVLVAFLAAMSATRRLTPLARAAQRPLAPPRPAPVPRPEYVAPQPEVLQQEPPRQEPPRPEPPRPEGSRIEASPLWARPGESQVTLTDDPGQRREVFVKLARRLQSLINRAIKRIDELEQENEDPELLDGLYEIDHLFTLARRQGENLAVLGGESPQRRSNKPVSVYAVLLAAVSEAEHYRQIAIVPVEEVEIHGHAVAEIIHLLAELLENATRFTSPDGPKVEVRAHKVTAGLAIEVQDRGLGMSHEDLERINQLLDGSTRIDLSELLEDGRIGLAVVRELARRHNIRVRLQSNIFGGIAAAVVIPPPLLSTPEREPRHRTTGEYQRQTTLPKRGVDETSRRGTESAARARGTDTSGRLTPAVAENGHQAERTRVTTEPAIAAPSATRQAVAPTRAATDSAAESGRASVSGSGAERSSVSANPQAPGDYSGPIQVPAPLPIPTASVQAPPSVPGLGPIRPAQPARRAESEDELPALPVRAPGRSYDELRGGKGGAISEAMSPEPETEGPPPLPQRRGSHLREELLEPPAPTRPVPGHNTSLMKTFQAGRETWFADRDNAKKSRGDSWPTT
ncbi:ATP-binding protein [Actinophytocola oryzae]|uniref:histidine kinase n=1 Tax=Actinophytocola oryzae TaxID=502181 RepID=A0A4R7W1H4_9PSEU|nr:ATP-binding protein [Actinophytocola oryzae]TDV55397.1 histidine kinase/DNA gyrase B/HSP90-like ATPase [Actinophytocola oryzae]